MAPFSEGTLQIAKTRDLHDSRSISSSVFIAQICYWGRQSKPWTWFTWASGGWDRSLVAFVTFIFLFFKSLLVTRAWWFLHGFEKRVGTCYTQTSRICCWVGISFVTEVCLLGECSAAGERACAAGEEWGSAALAASPGCTARANGRGEGKLNPSEILFWACRGSGVHGAPRVEVRSFFFCLLLSGQTWAFFLFFSLLSFFSSFSFSLFLFSTPVPRNFSVELDRENAGWCLSCSAD